MSSEQMAVLRMLSDGRIDFSQAERLLVVLTGRRKLRKPLEPTLAPGHPLSDECLRNVPMYGIPPQI